MSSIEKSLYLKLLPDGEYLSLSEGIRWGEEAQMWTKRHGTWWSLGSQWTILSRIPDDLVRDPRDSATLEP